MNLVTEQELIDLIGNAKTKSELSLPYTLAILSSISFLRVNKMIMLKWSSSALGDIKREAWGILGFLNKPIGIKVYNRFVKHCIEEYKNNESD